MEKILSLLRELPLWQLAVILFLENLLIFLLVILLGDLVRRWFIHRPVSFEPEPIDKFETTLAISTVVLNTVVTFFGLVLWRSGIITFRTDNGLRALLDIPILLLIMDFAMYALHRIAHNRILFSIMHRTHHRYERLRPLTLFALSPVENLGFGLLWLVVITVYPASWMGMSAYLAINVSFGAIGHLSVEPFPDSWKNGPVLNYISTSSFHAQHHNDLNHNFGFYTLVWDRLFGTLSPRYRQDFGQLPKP
ncbi:MAG TPA: sterol desaturase family protein [Blastocatellia bacterium]|nr:sterol desaturase family protein [Blastocatellia bacterium]